MLIFLNIVLMLIFLNVVFMLIFIDVVFMLIFLSEMETLCTNQLSAHPPISIDYWTIGHTFILDILDIVDAQEYQKI